MPKPLSVQLYTVRHAIADDLPGALRRVADIGFTNVELFGYVDRVPEYRDALAAAGLTAPSGHARLLGQDVDQIIDASLVLGVQTLIDPHIDDARWTTRDDVEAIAHELSAIAARAADRGLAIGYHNHAFELENRIDGAPALEVFANALSDAVVLELDTYWCEVGGESAPAILGRLGDRVQFLHVKDGPKTKVDTEQTAVGSGSMPIQAILDAAPQAQRVVELDDHDGDVFQALTDSYSFLQKVSA
ncbi:sugar phosphate isomerase/epimerase family protein [Curtobacterium ammoniigenes]|uniref:sugar phosphate isomerase/epimerase family protein n=1 Tax=Curtobacterium ammoniigenes TaxID=395387 RepID=UPI000B0C3681|nr:sugar phosphate isomerase/epimerase [Curtobacterium ammoniigenes]